MGYKLWASANAAPLLVCQSGGSVSEDDKQRLSDKAPDYASRIDFDWTYGVRFKLVTELVDYMHARSVEMGQKCSRLAIMAHGDPGLVDIESASAGNFARSLDQQSEDFKKLKEKALTPDTIGKFTSALARLNDELAPGAYVLFMSCNMAGKREGAMLLMELSKVIKNASVVGFTRIGTSFQIQSVKHCDYPGMKVGNYVAPAGSEKDEFERKQALLTAPFANEANPFAKVANSGKLVKDPEPELAPGAAVPAGHWVGKLIGSWGFEIGDDFQGSVGFEGNLAAGSGRAYWVNSTNMTLKHYGKWTALGGTEISFEFDDDQPGWKRLFKVKIEGPTSVGYITIGSVPHGMFKMIDYR